MQERSPAAADPTEASGQAPEGDPDLPELEVDRLDGDAEALKRAGEQRAEVVQHPLHGTWIQESTDSTADFGIGGYSQSMLSIDMIGGVVTVLRVVSGTAPVVMPGEFRIASAARAAGTLDGECTLSLDASLTSRFPARGGSVGGASFEAPSGAGPGCSSGSARPTHCSSGPSGTYPAIRHASNRCDAMALIQRRPSARAKHDRLPRLQRPSPSAPRRSRPSWV